MTNLDLFVSEIVTSLIFRFVALMVIYVFIIWLVTSYFVNKEKIKNLYCENFRLRNDIAELKLPKRKINISDHVNNAFLKGKIAGYEEGFSKGKEYQIANPDSKIEVKVDEN